MFAFSFGHGSFNYPTSEQCIILVIAPKTDYSSMDSFLTGAFAFMNTDSEFYDDWEKYDKNRTYTPASDSDIAHMRNRLNEMNQKISILHEPILNAVHIIPPQWNDISLGLETSAEYILYIWGTSA